MLEARKKNEQGLGMSRMDEYEIQDEGDVYEYVDEEEYKKLVDSRRQREDFVVDDGERTNINAYMPRSELTLSQHNSLYCNGQTALDTTTMERSDLATSKTLRLPLKSGLVPLRI